MASDHPTVDTLTFEADPEFRRVPVIVTATAYVVALRAAALETQCCARDILWMFARTAYIRRGVIR